MIWIVVLGLGVGAAFGYALQRGGFCMNTAFRSLIFDKDLSVFRAYILALLINIVGVNLLDEFRIINLTITPFFWLATIVGGFIFGSGMVLAGGCGSGTCYRVGKGMVGSLVALTGFALGVATSRMGILNPVERFLRRPTLDILGEEVTLVNLLGVNRWVVIAVIVVIGTIWLLRSPKDRFVIGWNWRKTGFIIGAIGVVAWLASGFTGRDYGLSVTGPVASVMQFLVKGEINALDWGSFLIIGVPVGAFIAAKVTGEFGWKAPSPERIAQQLGGGIIMGVGASIAGGCNIGHGLTGISTLAVSSITATIFTILGVWTATYFIFARTAPAKAKKEVPAKA